MLDRTIPFRNVIMRCDKYGLPQVVVPDGFTIRSYQPGDEKAWAALEYEIGDFGSLKEAERYFKDNYLIKEAMFRERCLFLEAPSGEVIGSCIAWWDPRGDESVSSLHWVVMKPEYQGKGLGKLLCRKAMELYRKLDAFPVYLHTQPWSYKAILLYCSLEFRMQKRDTFFRYENQYEQAMEALKNVLTSEQYRYLEEHSEE